MKQYTVTYEHSINHKQWSVSFNFYQNNEYISNDRLFRDANEVWLPIEVKVTYYGIDWKSKIIALFLRQWRQDSFFIFKNSSGSYYIIEE